MSEHETRNIDIHLSRLATWLITTLGKAVLVSTFVGLVVALLAGAAGQLYLAIGGAPLTAFITFGAVLLLSRAPFPLDLDD